MGRRSVKVHHGVGNDNDQIIAGPNKNRVAVWFASPSAGSLWFQFGEPMSLTELGTIKSSGSALERIDVKDAGDIVKEEIHVLCSATAQYKVWEIVEG
jgi:hypothetical protein